MQTYTNVILTIIAILLAFILLKVSEPAERMPTVGDMMSLRDIKDSSVRRERQKQLLAATPITWVEGGSIKVSDGSIEVSGGYITVDGEVSIHR